MVSNLAPERIKRCRVRDLEMRNGTPVMLEPEGLGLKIRTYFIGMEKRSYLIFSLGRLSGGGKAAYEYFYKGNSAKVFYSHEGVVSGFVSEILGYTASPYRHIYLKYPTVAESCSLREYKRTECHLPASFKFKGMMFSGLIINVSEGGCALCVRKDSEDALKELEKGADLDLNFRTDASGTDLECSCKIRNVLDCRDKRVFGIKFTDMIPETEEKLGKFISFVIAHRV